MDGFSTVDLFVEITECMAEMMKYVANEPSVGLFYVQQHVQNAAPNVITIKNSVADRSRDTSLSTQDLEDSITTVRSMKECGLPIANEMIKDIRKSIAVMSEKRQPRRGLGPRSSSEFLMRRSSSIEPPIRGDSHDPVAKKSGYYFSSMFKTAKERASSLKWPPIDLKDTIPSLSPSQFIESSSTSSSAVVAEADELLLSSQTAEDTAEELQTETKDEQLGVIETKDYDVFKADKQAKLEEWLLETAGTGD